MNPVDEEAAAAFWPKFLAFGACVGKRERESALENKNSAVCVSGRCRGCYHGPSRLGGGGTRKAVAPGPGNARQAGVTSLFRRVFRGAGGQLEL